MGGDAIVAWVMSDPPGVSIGATNLVAASVGQQPVIRRSVLTLFGHAPPEVGIPTASGVVLSGFVDRVGDSVPLVAADGTSYPAEQLLVEALESMAALAGPTPPSDVAIAVPSYWNQAMTGALQNTLAASEILSPRGLSPRLIPDAVAALTFKLSHEDLSVYNAVQRLLYLGVILAGVTVALSGLAIWKPVQLQGLTAIFGRHDAADVVRLEVGHLDRTVDTASVF